MYHHLYKVSFYNFNQLEYNDTQYEQENITTCSVVNRTMNRVNYSMECHIEYKTECQMSYTTKQQDKCFTIYHKRCREQYKTVYEEACSIDCATG